MTLSVAISVWNAVLPWSLASWAILGAAWACWSLWRWASGYRVKVWKEVRG